MPLVRPEERCCDPRFGTRKPAGRQQRQTIHASCEQLPIGCCVRGSGQGNRSVASQLTIDTLSGRSFDELSNDSLRQQLQHQIGDEVCEKTDGKVVTVYFIDFVMQ